MKNNAGPSWNAMSTGFARICTPPLDQHKTFTLLAACLLPIQYFPRLWTTYVLTAHGFRAMRSFIACPSKSPQGEHKAMGGDLVLSCNSGFPFRCSSSTLLGRFAGLLLPPGTLPRAFGFVEAQFGHQLLEPLKGDSTGTSGGFHLLGATCFHNPRPSPETQSRKPKANPPANGRTWAGH